MDHTENYQLSQWERSDKVLMEDFNADNIKIDSALGELSQSAAEHSAAIARLGNCQIYFTTYTGSGGTTRSHTFPGRPVYVCIMSASDGYFVPMMRGIPSAIIYTTLNGVGMPVTWSGNTVTWEHFSLNNQGAVYYIMALLDAAE